MKVIGVMSFGVVLYLIVSRLSPDAIGMGIGLLMGLLAGIPTALITLIAMRSNERSRERERDREQAFYRQLPQAQPPIIVIANPGGHQIEAHQSQPAVERGQFRLVEYPQGDDWR